ncbi:hypothetical protein QCE73_08965 [Caballeronia sp. LZ029]|uniref:hypothetical protein n=1 Tax=Caballeronia sp. LZ029 TaxID=3038564 RepID=UPI0028588BFE|nr:hypothetical protein [Caballeronia sp. LZ029]MDR5743284.1 hypothetical protein [Caballeronia sp. LZ029]
MDTLLTAPTPAEILEKQRLAELEYDRRRACIDLLVLAYHEGYVSLETVCRQAKDVLATSETTDRGRWLAYGSMLDWALSKTPPDDVRKAKLHTVPDSMAEAVRAVVRNIAEKEGLRTKSNAADEKTRFERAQEVFGELGLTFTVSSILKCCGHK